jgi:hypothetical protein
MNSKIRKDLRVFATLAVIVIVVQFFISLESYPHDLYVQFDSTWYFMCGKAWMNGLMPYVDFADSKGPLLWLIFGIAYLLSPHTFLGVYWMTCLFYTVTLFFVYKTAGIFLQTRRGAFLVSIVMMVILLDKAIRNDVHTEDFTLTFFAISLYYTCRALYAKQSSPVRSAFWIGVSMGAALLIKFTAAAMLVVFALSVLYKVRRTWSQLLRSFLSMVSGFCVIVLPFVVYFLLNGTLKAFLYEYFVQTFITTQGADPWFNTRALLFSLPNLITLVLVVPGLLLVPKILKSYRWFPLIAFAWIYLLSIPNGWINYLIPVNLLAVFTVVLLAWAFGLRRLPAWCDATFVVLMLLFVVGTNVWLHDLRHPDTGTFFMQDNRLRQQFYAYEYVMAQVPQSRVIYCGGVPPVYGICSDALPACKYFAVQYGATDEMMEDQWRTIRERKADFVVVQRRNQDVARRVLAVGYQSFYYPICPQEDFILYCKRDFRQPPHHLNITNWDVLLKRTPDFARMK